MLLDLFMIRSLDDFNDIIFIVRLILFIVGALLSLAFPSDDFCRRFGGTFKGFCYILQRYLVTNKESNDGGHRQMR